MIDWLLIILAWQLIIWTHKLLLKWMPYKWLIHSIKYPYDRLKIRWRYKRMTPEERLKAWSNYDTSKHWTKDYWFGRAGSNYVLMKFIKNDNEIIKTWKLNIG